MEQIIEIPLEALRESPFNPRRTFVTIDELAADIKGIGKIHTPLRVRPILPNPLRDDVVDGFEIVFGHRRFRAATLAGLPTAPCVVERMNDEDARRLQISENLARQDVHPIEEAEGFQALIDNHGMTADAIVEQTGKSRSYVYGRLKLLQAVPQVRDACLAGDIGSEVALLIARLRTPKLQEKALETITKDGSRSAMGDGGKTSFRRIRELLADAFTLELRGALFDPEDALLVEAAGACGPCPKRTGNAPEFADLVGEREGRWGHAVSGDANVCTDPDCFGAKKRRHLELQARELASAGKTVIEGAKAKAALDANGRPKGAYVALKDVQAILKKRKAKVDTVTIQDPRNGALVEAVKRVDLVTAGMVEAGDAKPKTTGASRDWEAERKAREEKALRVEQRNRAVFDQARARLAGQPLDLFMVQTIAKVMYDQVRDSDDADLIHELWGETIGEAPGWNREGLDEVFARIDQLDGPTATRLILDCILSAGVCSSGHTDEVPFPLCAVAERLDIEAEDGDPSEQAEAAEEA